MMKTHFYVDILPQPNDTTCGPTCLHAVYRYYNDHLPLQQVISETRSLEGGGTLAVFLGCHAIKRNYSALIYTYNLEVFDPTWFIPNGPDLSECLKTQLKYKNKPKIHVATQGYLEFLEKGGKIYFEDLTKSLIIRYLDRSIPILTGSSATYLYKSPREIMINHQLEYDDIRGEPGGHFVVLCGYDKKKQTIMIADPLKPNPVSEIQQYEIDIDRVISSILLGILTYDANLLIIEPQKTSK